MKLLSQDSLVEWLSFLENLSSKDVVVMEGFYSVFTIEPLRKPPFGLYRILESYPVWYLRWNDV